MVSIVTNVEPRVWDRPLAEMHRDRKRVFVDRLGWDVAVVDDEFEVDQFDTTEAVYLIVPEDNGEGHLGSVRLLPTAKPHLLSDIFPHLCEEGAPTGADVWEITRLCTRPDLEEPRLVRRQIMLALTEFALVRGIARYTCVTHLPFLSRLLAVGWECEPLGMPAQHGCGLVGAMSITITPATLPMLRAKTGVQHPVLDWTGALAA